jgi:phosphoesterase RecJ-like protein
MMRLRNKDIQQLKSLINEAKTITIITHFNPDGDAIGTTVGLYHYLKLIGKESIIIIPNQIPQNIMFILKDVSYIISENKFQDAKRRLKTTDLLFVVDMNNNTRVNEALENLLNEITPKTVLIDHHVKPDKFDINFSFPNVSSSSEVLFFIIKKLSTAKIFTKEIASALLVGISTDTGSFSYSCNHPEVYNAVATLLKTGVKANKIHQQVFDTYSINRMNLLGYAISKKLKIFTKERAAFIYLSKKELNYYHYQIGDLEGVVNYCLKLENIDFCALLSERDTKIRMSFRSNDEKIDVNKFANRYWNGGGHVMASGGKSFESLDVVVEKLTNQIKKRLFISND